MTIIRDLLIGFFVELTSPYIGDGIAELLRWANLIT